MATLLPAHRYLSDKQQLYRALEGSLAPRAARCGSRRPRPGRPAAC